MFKKNAKWANNAVKWKIEPPGLWTWWKEEEGSVESICWKAGIVDAIEQASLDV